MLSLRLPVRVGCGRLRPCEKSNMFDISPDPNRLFFPAINKMSSPRLPQASSDQIYTVLCCPTPPATLSRRPLVPDPLYLMPLFHQRIKPRSCRRPLIVGSLGKNGKKIDQWGGRQNRCEGLGLTTDRPQDAPGGPRQSLTGLGLRTD